MALTWSKGSLQALQDHRALHAVDPNRLSSRVSREPHCGHLTASVSATGPVAGLTGWGGATPYSSRAALPASVIQSVVQAGLRTVLTSTSSYPAPWQAASTSARIDSIAGQPEYVGVMVTTTRSSDTETPRRMPRSAMVMTGSSGSGTARSASMTALTTSHPGESGAGAGA